MMEIIGLERCHPESLHLLDEGITTDLFKGGFLRQRNGAKILGSILFSSDL